MVIFLVKARKRRMKDDESQITRNHLSHSFTVKNSPWYSESNVGVVAAVRTPACASALPSALSKFAMIVRIGDGGGFVLDFGVEVDGEGGSNFVFAKALLPN